MYHKLIPKGVYGVFGETSEITGAEDLAKARAINPKVGAKWYKTWQAYQNDVIEAHKTDDLSEFERPPRATSRGKRSRSKRRRLAISRRSGASAARSMRPRQPAEAPRKDSGFHGHVIGGGRVCQCG